MLQKITLLLAAFFFSATVFSQEEDLFKMLDEDSKKQEADRTDYTTATFKTSRLINGHTIETTGKRVLDFKISHRFGTVNSGIEDFFGLDNATMRMGLDYGITDHFTVGLGRSTFQKQVDGFLKYRLLRQSTGKRVMPVTVTAVASAMIRTQKDVDQTIKRNFSDRLYYAFQLLVARKFSEGTSIQLAPTIVHHNIVPFATNPNDIFALGIGGRQKISKRVSINGEYYLVNPQHKLPNTTNSLSLGVDIETGGHVFQLHFTNSRGMTERTFITETQGEWGNGDIYFGFNISRVFVIGKKKKPKDI
ncbi:DUF5777 family beta-barrel protein [Aridibaculum aurantiacum]|uniref:DUF5777 family beta-barrel protein n=1 Tax=Aridibaculum aurantiacum TaxID=2810307 RepID=UPI001A9643F2|nr:DUF5777 family beta-barrel protein [Aridibaculum aurantiacum]